MKLNRKLLTVVLAAALALMLAVGAMADLSPTIDKDAKGTVTVTKYQYNTTITTDAATGLQTDDPTEGTGAQDLAPLSGVTFTLYPVVNTADTIAYYNGSNGDTYTVADFKNADGTYKTVGAAIEETTDADGKATFENLSVGIYILEETSAPTTVTGKAETTLVSVPMVNTADSGNNGNAGWMYDIYVYPKNATHGGNVQIRKNDQDGSPIANIGFTLNKYTDANCTAADSAFTAKTATTDASGYAEFKDLQLGYYGVKENASPNGYILNTEEMYFRVNNDNTVTFLGSGTPDETKADDSDASTNPAKFTDLTVSYATTYSTANDTIVFTVINEMPDLEKLVAENSETAAYVTDTQYSIGDSIGYKITVDVPANVADLKTFTITDTPSAGLTDTVSTIVVKADGTELTSGTDYTATATDAGGFTLTFKAKADGTVAAADKEVVITYSAVLNADAVIGGSGNTNTAQLAYSVSDDPAAANTYTIDDTAVVYTYKYSVTKHQDSEDGAVMGGVEFQLLGVTADGKADTDNPISVVKIEDGKYRPAITGTDTTTTTTLATKSDGTLLIEGLENGTYYLKETKTLDNYNLLSEPYEITVNVAETTAWDDTDDWTDTALHQKTVKTVTLTNYSPADDGTDPLHADIINKKGFTLPQTGSLGYLAFCAIGVVLIGGGAVLLISGRKKKVK